MDEQVRKYNTQIRELLDLISAELPNSTLVDVIRRRFRVALSIDRTYILEETSPEMLLYRDIIAEGKYDELIYKNWEEEIEKKDGALMHEVDNNSLRDMIGLLRQVWESYDEEQKNYIQKALRKLLSYCIKYHKAKAEESLRK